MRTEIRSITVIAWALACAGCSSSDSPGAAALADAGFDASPALPPGGTPRQLASPAALPPPISGGTLAITSDGATAVVSDPDLDRVLLVDLATRAVTATLALQRGDEPGRIALDHGGRAHVILRGGGALVTVDLATRAIVARRAVCLLPRGVAWDVASDDLQVVCTGGELVTLPAAGGPPSRTVMLERDLRDVVVSGDRLLVTRFRSGEVLTIDPRGVVVQRVTPAVSGATTGVAWRMVPAPAGGVWLLHQRTGLRPITIGANGYYSSDAPACAGTQGIVRPGVVWVRPPFDPVVLPDVPNAPLAVDVAVDPTGSRLAVAAPSNVDVSMRPAVTVFPTTASGGCLVAHAATLPAGAQAVAVAFAPSGALVVQTREPSTLAFPDDGGRVALGGASVANEGHRLFHTNPTGLVVCASCHAEGDDDGRTWNFTDVGPRRTQSIRGGIAGTEPFHWSGDLRDFDALITEVFVRRMGAHAPSRASSASLMAWVDALPVRARPSIDGASAERGDAIFHSPEVGCAGCHSGPRLTNNATVDVGTGGSFQVPTLRGIAWRPPYMHDGCAPTLRDRFTLACGGGDRHGHTSQLTSEQVGDLAAYLETL